MQEEKMIAKYALLGALVGMLLFLALTLIGNEKVGLIGSYIFMIVMIVLPIGNFLVRTVS